ncbi:MAG: helix-turn-helix transcriptional regulator [Christensenellaceae bacterium]|nr:helix-turn-helix transcriptional regulator [Christensenellaceae bacterium]DAS00363.1 MAG TPA: Repressor protein CI [Bacteriophage sp.]
MRLKFFRDKKSLTQKNIANVLGLSVSTISKWESGISKPRADTLKKLADLLNCTIDDLLKDKAE